MIQTATKKIFQIGFNKCGTYSIYHLFNQYSRPRHKTIHWDHGKLAYSIYNNITSGKAFPLSEYDQYFVFTDMECFIADDSNNIRHITIYKDFFDLLDINYPDSVFILNTRPVDHWIKSRLQHRNPHNTIINNHDPHICNNYPMYIDLYKSIYKTTNEKDITDIWKNEWYEHHDTIQLFFGHRPKDLLVYDIENDSFDKFVKFFDYHNIYFSTNQMPHLHITQT